jgi:hypothetical protein
MKSYNDGKQDYQSIVPEQIEQIQELRRSWTDYEQENNVERLIDAISQTVDRIAWRYI